MSCDRLGKLSSIFLACWNCGSFTEKKKSSSTCGVKSTRTTTSPIQTAVRASRNQCIHEGAAVRTTETRSRIALMFLIYDTKKQPQDQRSSSEHIGGGRWARLELTLARGSKLTAPARCNAHFADVTSRGEIPH